MNGKTHRMRRKVRLLVLALALAAFAAPAAQASNRLVDDWFRDGSRVPQTSIGLIDDSFRDNVEPAVKSPLVDDYFRDPQTVAPVVSQPVLNRLVDDSFRDASRVATTQTKSDSFNWGAFGIGAGVALGALLIVAGLGIGLHEARQARHRLGHA